MLNRFLEPGTVRRYRAYRAAQQALHSQMIDTMLSRPVFDRAARDLGVAKSSGRRLVLESTDELSVVMDYALYEVGAPGARVVDRYHAETGGANQTERELLDAMAAAAASLWRVEAVDKRLCQLTLKQLALAERSATIIDINFSRLPVQGAVIFSRLLALPQFTMTGGAVLVFDDKQEAPLRQLWAKSAPGGRYRRIFKFHRQHGIPIAYADVGGRRGKKAASGSVADE